MTRDNLLLNSACLEDYFHRDRIQLSPLDLPSITIDPHIVAPVSAWTQSVGTQILTIAGPVFEGYELENPMTMFAAKFIAFATASKVPTISYFCELRRHEELIGDNTKEMQGLLQMVYALMRQMIELVLPEVNTTANLRLERFTQLDATVETWDEALAIFSDVQSLLPGTVFCVVDGVQWLDSRRVNKYVAQFIEVLRCGKLKLLFTSAGQVRCFSQALRRSELLVLEDTARQSRGMWVFEEAQFAL